MVWGLILQLIEDLGEDVIVWLRTSQYQLDRYVRNLNLKYIHFVIKEGLGSSLSKHAFDMQETVAPFSNKILC